MLEAKHLSYHIRNKYLLRDVSLRVRPGELVAVIGANGAGKSTLLKTLAGELSPRQGEVTLNQRPLHQWKALELARTRGVLSQSVQVAFPMSVLETVLLGRFAFQARESAEQSRALAYWALQQVQLQHFAHRNIMTLSGGEQQRVHLARVLTQIYEEQFSQPKLLLLDEPVSSLDIAKQHRLLELTQRLTRTLPLGALVILHDMNLAAQYADKVVMMKQGSVVAQGKPEHVFVPKTIFDIFGIEAVVQPHPICNCLQITPYHYQQTTAS